MKRKLIMIVAALLLCGAMNAQNVPNSHFMPNNWDYHNYVGPMSVIGQVYFNDEIQNNANLEIASFVGEEFRGNVMLIEPFPNVPDLGYFAYLPCYFDTPGETFTFKAYDHATGTEYDVCTTTAIGNEDGYGEIDDPYNFYFTVEEELTYGPEYPWVPSTNYPGEGMMVAAQIKINGELVDRATYEVGAFCGDECRANSNGGNGSPLDDFTEDDLGYFAFMNVMGNDGDIINFYLYDQLNSCIVEATCSTTLTLENGGELGIDIFGGDIFVLNFIPMQSFTKNITGYTENGGYYILASPIGDVNPENVTNMLSNDYDLYYFDQTQELEWINYEGNNGGFNLQSGKGYLYANNQNVTLTFTGTPYTGSGEITLERNDEETTFFKGWNLVGNPFAETAYIADGRGFYTINSDGNEIIEATNNNIEAMEGIFVIAESDGETMTFTTEAPGKANEQIVLNVNHNHGTTIDRAIIRFGEGRVLPKFMLNKNNTKIYIPQGMDDFAMVRGLESGEVPVSFKAAQNGTYSINVNVEEVQVSYMHLIDNMTGADIDLLQNPNYSFNAQTTDHANRFKLVFATGNAADDNFAFFSNGNWIINNDGKATVQIVDVTGRILKAEQIEGCSSMSFKAASGVYMVRLINGDNMKVQKIVVE